MNKVLESGQPIAVKVANGSEEKEFSGVVRSFDRVRGLISLEMEGQITEKTSFFLGKEAAIVGRSAGSDLDLPCIVDEESRLPILVCRRMDRRDHLRVNTFLHLKYRPVGRDLYEADPEGFLLRVGEEMGNGEGAFESLADEAEAESLSPRILYVLEDLNRKLDRILAILEDTSDGQPGGVVAVNISGSGLRFPTRERMEAGRLLAIRIVLPLSPPAPVVFVGEVKRVKEKGQGEFETAVRFVAIDEGDRDKIVHYAFKRMRESIRNRNKTGET